MAKRIKKMGEKSIRTITEDIIHTYAGKKLPPGYDWPKDPEGFKKEGRIPKNRCFHCGSKFVGSEIAAFCNVCDHAMAIGGEDMLRGFSFERRDARIRIPEDMSEEQYRQKLASMSDLKPPEGNSFVRADELV